MNHQTPTVIVPARLASSDANDPRVAGANQIFFNILELIRAAGLEPVVVESADVDLTQAAGVVLPGGGDVDPARYDGQQIPELYDVNPEQDDLDFAIATRALELDLPIFGICRGAQVLNVIYGGTLHEDLAASSVVHTPPEVPGCESDEFIAHNVTVEAGSFLASTLGGAAEVSVQSSHHQGVKQLGDGLTVAARAADGLIEAFEDPTRWVVAVQWHPEVEPQGGPVRDGQFAALAAEVTRRSAQQNEYAGTGGSNE